MIKKRGNQSSLFQHIFLDGAKLRTLTRNCKNIPAFLFVGTVAQHFDIVQQTNLGCACKDEWHFTFLSIFEQNLKQK